MITLTTGRPLTKRWRFLLASAALLSPLAFASAAVLLARAVDDRVHIIFALGVGIGILVGAVAVGILVRVRLAAFMVVLVYLAVTLPVAAYFIVWSGCIVLGDCL